MTRTVKILVSGRVQGVCFRQSTKNKAKKFGILGTARNLDDGRVEIIAQAEAETLGPFIEWCHKGPIAARVDHVEQIELQAFEYSFAIFEIR
jgi:acylphosphatase